MHKMIACWKFNWTKQSHAIIKKEHKIKTIDKPAVFSRLAFCGSWGLIVALREDGDDHNAQAVKNILIKTF